MQNENVDKKIKNSKQEQSNWESVKIDDTIYPFWKIVIRGTIINESDITDYSDIIIYR